MSCAVRTRSAPNLREVKEAMDESLAVGSDARKMSVALGTVEYSGELTTQLMEASECIEKLYKKMGALKKTDEGKVFEDPGKAKKYLEEVKGRLKWLASAKAGL